MTTDPNYQSDQEIVKRLHSHLAETFDAETRPARRIRLSDEVDELVQVLATRIYAGPDVWGLSSIPERFRDDVAHDVLLGLLNDPPKPDERESTSEWFGKRAERLFRDLWRQSEFDGEILQTDEVGRNPNTGEASENELLNLDNPDGPWHGFEAQFPRDAFALRLRYVIKRSPEEMMVMLDAPSTGAVHSRLSRARGRMRMFFEQSKYDRKTVMAMLAQFGDSQVEEEE